MVKRVKIKDAVRNLYSLIFALISRRINKFRVDKKVCEINVILVDKLTRYELNRPPPQLCCSSP